MTRNEAFEALFGPNPDATASQEAVEALGDSPEPTNDEAGGLNPNTIDNVGEFTRRPTFYAEGLTDGSAKVLLAAYAAKLEAKVTVDVAKPVIVEALPVEAVEEPAASVTNFDDLVAAAVAAPSGGGARTVLLPPSQSAPRAPVVQAPRTAPGATAPSGQRQPTSEQPRRDDRRDGKPRDEDRREPPLTPPARASDPITIGLREIVNHDSNWPSNRDAIIEAHRAFRNGDVVAKEAARVKLARAIDLVKAFKSGQNGPQMVLFGQLMGLLIADLNTGLNHHDATEFRRRYW
ncbi:hypothetical protein HZA85_03360 [Candidatus Uhrbacteria bacterium]|nr:hypothetical protein [Candidatus Uhrbacteria bacterium]